MSILNVIKQTLGLSGTASENHHWDGSVANQLKLKKGTPASPGVDVMTVDAAGKPDFPQLIRSLGTFGSYELPGGLIIKWGTEPMSLGDHAVTYSTPFTTATYNVQATLLGAPGSGIEQITASAGGLTVSGFNIYPRYGDPFGAGIATQNIMWIAIGK